MIGFVIRQVDLQEMQTPVDSFYHSQTLDHSMDGADAAHIDATRPVGEFVMDIAGRQHRLLKAAQVKPINPSFDPPLAVSQLLVYGGVHSKSLLLVGERKLLPSLKHRKRREISSFFHEIPMPKGMGYAWLRIR